MSTRLSWQETVTAVRPLTPEQLEAFVAAQLVIPVQTDAGPGFRSLDLPRLELLCELADQFALHEDALGVVIGLIDQLYSARADLQALAGALRAEQPETARRICDAAWHLRHGAPSTDEDERNPT